MNTKLLLIAIAVVSLSSCSSVYKSGQTPDDVYYSPVRTYEEQVVKKEEAPRTEEYSTYSERSQIRLGINNARWRYLDDYSYNPYMYGYNYGYYYNPYYCPFPVYNHGNIVTVNPKNNTPRMTNLAAYNTAYNNSNGSANAKYYNPVTMPVRSYNNNSSKLSNTLNKIFNSSSNYNNSNNNNSQNSSNQSSRSYTPSSSSTKSTSSGSSSSGGTTSRPVRNGKG